VQNRNPPGARSPGKRALAPYTFRAPVLSVLPCSPCCRALRAPLLSVSLALRAPVLSVLPCSPCSLCCESRNLFSHSPGARNGGYNHVQNITYWLERVSFCREALGGQELWLHQSHLCLSVGWPSSLCLSV